MAGATDFSYNHDSSRSVSLFFNNNSEYRVCFSFMKNAQDAEDMVQETFLKLISCQRQFETQEHEKAWLIVTASNTCKDELRRWKRRLENIKVFSRQENAAAIEDDSVLEWVMALPVKYKQVIYLYYYEGYRTSEIANMLHCTESTVRNQLLRGRRLLKKSYVFLAAVLAGSLFVATTVYAVYNYGLRDLFLRKETVWDLSKRKLPTKEVDIISLAGFAGSAEYKACSEWNAVLSTADFEFMRTVKGSFNPDTLSIGSMEDYREWTYTTQNGQSVLLAKSESKALIVVEREKSFLVVNVLVDLTAGTLDMDDAALEELVDCFDFSAIP